MTVPTQLESSKRDGPWLKNGNPVGNPSSAPRCGAKTRSGTPCRNPAMRNPRTGRQTRCRMHGGSSCGPTSPEGIERCRRANWKHGRYSAEAKAARREQRAELRDLTRELKQLEKMLNRISVRKEEQK